MAFIPALNTAQVHVRTTLLSQQVENILYFENSDTIGAGDLITLCEYVGDWWNDHLKGNLSNQLTMREIYAVDMTSSTAPTGVDLTHNGVAGSQTSPAMPGNVTIAISFRTAGRGRSSRGRNYLPGMVEAGVSGNSIDNTYGALFVAAYEELISDPLTGWTWVVASFYANHSPRVTALLQPILSCGLSDNVMDSMRRRLPGRGS